MFIRPLPTSVENIDFPKGQVGVQICFEEALKLREKQFERAESKLREKKESKKLSREPQDVPEEAPSHDPLTLSSGSDLPRSYDTHRSSVDPAAAPLRP